MVSNSNDILLSHQHDDVVSLDNDSNNVDDVNNQRSFIQCVLHNKKCLFIFTSAVTLSLILIGVIVYSLQSKVTKLPIFKNNLYQLGQNSYQHISHDILDESIKELTELYKLGHISDDHNLELETYVQFNEYNKKYSKIHVSTEDKRNKFINFRRNFIKVNTPREGETYVRRLNKFSDMSREEFMALFPPMTLNKNLNVDFVVKSARNSCPAKRFINNPEYLRKLKLAKGLENDVTDVCKVTFEGIDWRRGEGVTPIRNQGNCGSCWAFAAVASVEGAYLIQKLENLSLSPQELVNCERNSYGCNGGYTDVALEYIKNSGISSEDEIPYIARLDHCIVNSTKKHRINDFINASGRNISKLLLPIGPVLVHIAVDEELSQYGGGIYNGACADRTNHAVVLVGEGKDEVSGKRYWIIKNSWGEEWGEDGYLKLERTDEGNDNCQVLELGRLPLLY